jgi:hypothetical protein
LVGLLSLLLLLQKKKKANQRVEKPQLFWAKAAFALVQN